MKLIKKETLNNGHIVLTIQTDLLFGLVKTERKYLATKEFPTGYWNWVKLPNRTLVGDLLSFQLDSWCKNTEL